MADTATITKPAAETKTETEQPDSKAAETTTKTDAASETAATEAASKEQAAKDAEMKVAADKAAEDAAKSKDVKETKPEATVKEPVVYDLKAPKDSLLSKDDIERVQKISQEKNLTPEQAQALLEDEHAAVAAYDTRQKALLTKESETWKELARTDKEFGGEEFAKNIELSKRVVDRFGSKEFKEALSKTGLGNHPELVRVFVRIGKQMSDDELKIGSAGAAARDKTAADKMFPTTATKGES